MSQIGILTASLNASILVGSIHVPMIGEVQPR